jgi:hypothetical protein
MDTNLQLNAVEFLRRMKADMQTDVEFAYPPPFNRIDHNRTDAALQRISSKIEVLGAFLAALESKPEIKGKG